MPHTVYPKKYAHGFCFAVLCCGYTLTDFPISIRLTSLALWQSNDCPSASKATLMNMDKYFKWIHSERLHNHNKAKHNETVCIFLGIYCICVSELDHHWFRQWLVACSVLAYCQLDPNEHGPVKFESNAKLFIHENVFEISSVKWQHHDNGPSNGRHAIFLVTRLIE